MDVKRLRERGKGRSVGKELPHRALRFCLKKTNWASGSGKKAEGPPRRGRWSRGAHRYALLPNEVLV